MGIYDRDYTKNMYSGGGGGGGMRLAMPSLTPIVKWLLMINLGVFLAMFMIPPIANLFVRLFAVWASPWWESLLVWRYISYQFLHGGFLHVLFNMLGLYFFGTMLERTWGSKHFLRFYLTCGAVGGIVYPLMVFANVIQPGFLLGASGSVYGIIAAVAILYPRVRVYIYGIFPVPMWVLGLIILFASIASFQSGDNAGGQVAHLAGLATGAVWVYWKPLQNKARIKKQHGKWTEKIQQERRFQKDVDHILAKVHKHGIKSLSRKEKKILKQATDREQKQNMR
ncbi:Rhomboid protease GlpG [Anaerohalosphaera lusitana]|uniref:Rhomboid protease GlpG n=1 Tax=Anaerohalosphaera lusitana TaxID=1936003 RepID=A0A1U9NM87_9BACT|nr:rhomboid family intramembrane serine protease [Anaerohalosphaera lusitana]AQT69023.1 Rhomboid protease GlpG [Anaerohalosphaera lusitana]